MNNPDQNKLLEAMQQHADRIAFEAKNGIALAQKLVDFYTQWYSHPGDPASFRLVRETFRQWQASQPAPADEATR